MPRFTHDLTYKSPLERGTDVLQAQRALITLGYLKGDADGLFGVQTAAAVKAFQSDKKLPSNGNVDQTTWDKLFLVPEPPALNLGVDALIASLGVSHQFQDSVSWRLTENGIAVGSAPAIGTPGAPITVEKILSQYGADIDDVCRKLQVPMELVVATIATESRGDAAARREEPGFTSDAATPSRVSIGLMQTLISTAQSVVPTATVTSAWLVQPRNAILAGTTYIERQKNVTQFDPPKVACAYNAGGLYHEPSAANRWRMRQFPIGTSAHADRFVAFFNDCIFTLCRRAAPPDPGEISFANAFQRRAKTVGASP